MHKNLCKPIYGSYALAENPAQYLDLIKKGYVLNDIGKSSTQIIKKWILKLLSSSEQSVDFRQYS